MRPRRATNFTASRLTAFCVQDPGGVGSAADHRGYFTFNVSFELDRGVVLLEVSSSVLSLYCQRVCLQLRLSRFLFGLLVMFANFGGLIRHHFQRHPMHVDGDTSEVGLDRDSRLDRGRQEGVPSDFLLGDVIVEALDLFSYFLHFFAARKRQ